MNHGFFTISPNPPLSLSSFGSTFGTSFGRISPFAKAPNKLDDTLVVSTILSVEVAF
jgi:hypothetical protein